MRILVWSRGKRGPPRALAMSGGVFGGQPVSMYQRVKQCPHVGGKGTAECLIGILQTAPAVLDDHREDTRLGIQPRWGARFHGRDLR
jgi:hypothetical protein